MCACETAHVFRDQNNIRKQNITGVIHTFDVTVLHSTYYATGSNYRHVQYAKPPLLELLFHFLSSGYRLARPWEEGLMKQALSLITDSSADLLGSLMGLEGEF